MTIAYAVVRANGEVKRAQGRLCIYAKLGTAKSQARREGESVVPVSIDLTTEPLFIRARRVDGAS